MLEPPLLLSFPCSNIGMIRSRLADVFNEILCSWHRSRAVGFSTAAGYVCSSIFGAQSRFRTVIRESREDSNVSPSSTICGYVCTFSVVMSSAFCYLHINMFIVWLSLQLIKYPALAILPFCIEYPEAMQYISTLLACCCFPILFSRFQRRHA